MMRALKWLGGLLVGNIGWKLLSVTLAFTIWPWWPPNPSSTRSHGATRISQRARRLEISSNPVSTVRLELRGPSGALRDLGANGVARPGIVLDMTDVQPGQRTFTIDDSAVKLPRGVRLVRRIPSEVRFEFERSASRTIPISVRFAGQGNNGYVVARYEVMPDTAEIVGPASHVRSIAAATTDPVDVSTLAGPSEFRVNAFVNDDYVRFQSPALVTVTVTMKKQ